MPTIVPRSRLAPSFSMLRLQLSIRCAGGSLPTCSCKGNESHPTRHPSRCQPERELIHASRRFRTFPLITNPLRITTVCNRT